MYTFPFEVPADLSALSAEEFATLLTQVREHAATVLADENAPANALLATRDLHTQVTAEDTRRTEQAAQATAARAELAAGLAPAAPVAAQPTEPTPEPTPEPEPVPAPQVPAPGGTEPIPAVTAAGGSPASTLDPVPGTERPVYAVLTASADAPNVGSELTFASVGELLERRLSSYPQGGKSAALSGQVESRRISGTHFAMGGRSLTRHNNVAIQRRFPEDLRITDANKAMGVLEYAGRQSRLPGGSLTASISDQVGRGGRSLTAAAGWCAPSETIYDLCMLETRDGMLDLPEVEAVRGGFNIPSDGGPNFASIYDSIGDDGDVILTEYDVINGTDKVCIEIPCPDFEEVRLDVAYLCLTGALLQRRGYPEIVNRFSQGALIGLDHKVNESVIARMVAGSGAPRTIPDNVGGDDAVSQLLSAVEVAAEDIKYRNRMGRGATIEVVLPAWAIAPMRAALARRRGVSEWDVADSEILAAFTTRHVVPHFVYDWQDAFSGLSTGPGRAQGITAFPTDISFLAYPAGTWVKAVRSVVNLDTVYDNAMLTQNQFTALFVEDGFAVMQMCTDSRLYTVGFDPNGLCCA